MFLFTTTLLAAAIALVQGAPNRVQRETPVPPEEIAALAPYTQFARATYCDPSLLRTWTCGQACNALPDFQPGIAGGDGNGTQVYFVGYWPRKDTVVVAHEGTEPLKILGDLTDLNVLQVPLDPRLFPGVPYTVLVHDGFRREQAQTATLIFAEVKKLMSEYRTRTLTIIGHSLGAAIAELDSLFFALNLPNIKIKAITYGTPRVGNRQFARLIDKHVPDFTRVNNKKDIVPIVPNRLLGFSHPAGEIHILSGLNAVACTGDDDTTDPHCTNAMVPNIFLGNALDHLGPYGGIQIGATTYCD